MRNTVTLFVFVILVGCTGCKQNPTAADTNHPPVAPSSPSPIDDATGITTMPVLQWTSSDPDGDTLTYDVYLSTANPPTAKIATVYGTSSMAVTGLAPNTTYYWSVTAKDSNAGVTTGTVWKFTTGAAAIDAGMVLVTGGQFLLGTITGAANEQPVHYVSVGSFYIDKTEITFEQWTVVRTWALSHGYTDLTAGRNGFNPAAANNPVTEVSWFDILKWCNARSEKNGVTPVYYTTSAFTTVYRTGELALSNDAVNWMVNGYRMPTEAEWEFAALGGTKSTSEAYSGSNTSTDVAWSILTSGNITHPAGQKVPNELGIFDMSGNVLEWCWDVYGTYASADQIDPKGPAAGNYHILRGGAFDATDFNCRVNYRNYSYPSYRFNDLGFRCTKD